jgi:hypothetical protein
MLCKKVLPLLSEYFDEVLDSETAIQVSQHLDQCARCRKELSGLSVVHDKLKSLSGVRAPEYMRDLVELRRISISKHTWRIELRHALERRWSLIRTTEATWYMTKALGAIMAGVFLLLIPYTINPLEVSAGPSLLERHVYTRAEKQRVALNVVANLGMLPKDAKKELTKSRQPAVKSAIHEQYLSNFAGTIAQDGNDYDFSVMTYVDGSGQGKVQNVLEHPNAQSFLNSFNKVISAGRFAPARENGKAVPSHMLLRIRFEIRDSRFEIKSRII